MEFARKFALVFSVFLTTTRRFVMMRECRCIVSESAIKRVRMCYRMQRSYICLCSAAGFVRTLRFMRKTAPTCWYMPYSSRVASCFMSNQMY